MKELLTATTLAVGLASGPVMAKESGPEMAKEKELVCAPVEVMETTLAILGEIHLLTAFSTLEERSPEIRMYGRPDGGRISFVLIAKGLACLQATGAKWAPGPGL